jgi:cobalamin biosynthesis protein CobD/CbiB
MTNEKQTLKKIKKTYDNVAVIAGVTMGVVLCSTFFTYGMLIDRNATVMLWAQIIISIVFIFCLVFIKSLAFLLTKILLAGSGECRQVFKGLTVRELDKVER